jgi:putative ABC transport system ATP-binding protein
VRILESLNEQGLTLVVVTHDREIGARANRRLVLQDGRIARDSSRE